MSERSNDATAAGAMLAAEREAQHLTIGDVSRHLKLAPAQVEALEAGDYERLPGRVFVRGFLRNYARLLGLDPQPLLRAADAGLPEPARLKEEPRRVQHVEMPLEPRSRWVQYTAAVALAVAVLLAIYEFGFNDQRSPAEHLVQPGTELVHVPAGVTSAQVVPPAPYIAHDLAPASDPTGGTSAAPPNTPGAQLASVGVAPAPSAAAEGRGALAGERSLHFRFEQESWVEVRDRDSRVIFSKLNRAGSEERVSGAPPFRLVIGNARNVRLTADDRPVDLRPHIASSVARFTLQ